MQTKKSLVILGLAVLFLVPLASAGFFDFLTGKAVTNVTATIESNQSTQIISVTSFAPVIAAGTSGNIVVNFTAWDADGSDDIITNSGKVNVTLASCNGEFRSRLSSSCVNTTYSVFYINFTCTVPFYYYDCDVAWKVNVSLSSTHAPLKVYNDTTTVTLNAISNIDFPVTSITFPPLSSGVSTDKLSLTNNLLNNTGNHQLTGITLNATDLHGNLITTEKFNMSFFKGLSVNSTNPTDICASGQQLVSSEFADIVLGTTGNKPKVNTDEGEPSQRNDIKYCITSVPTLSRQNYTTVQEGAWTVNFAFA